MIVFILFFFNQKVKLSNCFGGRRWDEKEMQPFILVCALASCLCHWLLFSSPHSRAFLSMSVLSESLRLAGWSYSEVLAGWVTDGTLGVFSDLLTAALPLSPLLWPWSRQFVSFHAELNISRSSVGKILLEIEKKILLSRPKCLLFPSAGQRWIWDRSFKGGNAVEILWSIEKMRLYRHVFRGAAVRNSLAVACSVKQDFLIIHPILTGWLWILALLPVFCLMAAGEGGSASIHPVLVQTC